MIAKGEVEVVKSASGGQIYQTETSSVTGGQYGSEVYYSKPVIAQTMESATRTVVDQTIDKQPIITRKVVSQPIIKQRIIQTPVLRQKTVDRPVYTEQVTNDATIQNETVLRNIPVAAPGNTTIREKTFQPVIKTIEEAVRIQKADNQVVNLPAVTKPIEYSEEIVNKEY